MATAERYPSPDPHVVLRIRTPRPETYDEEGGFGTPERPSKKAFDLARKIIGVCAILGFIASLLFFVAFHAFGTSFFFVFGMAFFVVSMFFWSIVVDSKQPS
jgi:hypothetical protein